MTKKKTIFLIISLVIFLGIEFVFADTCSVVFDKTEGHLGYYIDEGLGILQIAAPLIVIIYGSIDLFKAVVAPSEDKMRNAQQMLIKRIVIAVCLFLVPSLVKLLLTAVGLMGTCTL